MIISAGADGNIVESNNLGLDVTGTQSLGNTYGVFLIAVSDNKIGQPGAGNLISANKIAGIGIEGNDPAASSGVQGNLVVANIIGTDRTGTVGGDSIGNASDGVNITNSLDNTIGGPNPSDRNLISGNRAAGVDILGTGASGNQVLGNWIGTNLGGTSAVPNSLDGVIIQNAPGNVIGQVGAGNVIAGNSANGIQVFGPMSSGNVVLANLIGTGDHAGTAAARPTARREVLLLLLLLS